jgi:hypothetical protein
VREFVSLNTRQIETLDRSKTVVIVPGGILEEHGPALANASLGMKIYQQWLAQAKDLVKQVLTGKDYRKLPRYGDLTSGDPADIAAAKENARLEAEHAAWLQKHPLNTSH